MAAAVTLPQTPASRRIIDYFVVVGVPAGSLDNTATVLDRIPLQDHEDAPLPGSVAIVRARARRPRSWRDGSCRR